MSKPFAVHWFRRDLRLSGNPALAEAHAKSGGRVLGFFCFDPIFLARPDFSVNRFQFFLESLAALRDDLRQAGSELLVVDEGPDKAFARLFQQVKPHWVSFNRDYEPFAVARDERMRRFFFEQQTVTVEECDHLILEPSEVTKPNTEEGYSVFTPFSRRWFDLFDKNRVERQRPHKKQLHCNLRWSDVLKSPLNDVLDTYREKNRKHVTITIPKAGAHAAAECLKAFAPKINDYARARDVPSEVGTSHLSIYLKNGSITTAQIIGALELTPAEGRKKTSRGRFLTELVWREFYYHILARHPRVEPKSSKRSTRICRTATTRNNFAPGARAAPVFPSSMRACAN